MDDKIHNAPVIEAKNARTGSYAAGCLVKRLDDTPHPDCKQYESAS